MKIKRISRLSNIEHEMDLDVTEAQLMLWECGARVQDVFPHLTPEEREFIMTGITAEEWNDLFGPSKYEDEQTRQE